MKYFSGMIHPKVVLTFFFLCFVCYSLKAQDINWERNYFEKYGFSIELPVEPEYSQDTLFVDDFSSISNVWKFEVDIDSVAYYGGTIMVETYPSDYIHSDSSLALIESFLYSYNLAFAENTDFELVTNQVIEVKNYYGLQYIWKRKNDNMVIVYENILVNNTVYTLFFYILNPQVPTLVNKTTFITSFKLSDDIPNGSYNINEEKEKYLEAHFNIDFPTEPKVQPRIANSDFGRITDTSFSCNLADTLGYQVNQVILPEAYKTRMDSIPTEFYSYYYRIIHSFYTSFSIYPVYIIDKEINGITGKYIRLLGENMFCVVFIVHLDDYLYYVTFFGQNASRDLEKADPFIESFKPHSLD